MNTSRAKLKQTVALPAHVNRRMVDMTRVRAPVRHIVLPGHETAAADLREGETINALVKRTGWAARVGKAWAFRLPTICVLNGKPVLQKAWRRIRLRAEDVVEFWSKPYGGRGGGSTTKSVVGLVAVIALAAFAPWAGGALAGALGFTGALATSVFTGLITLGGALLIAALTAPKQGGTNDPTSTDTNIDPIYSVASGSNTEALLQPIPVQYGRIKSFPNTAITPWSEFEGNDQYLNVLLSVGLGRHSYEALYIDDTVLWTSSGGLSGNFTGVDVAFYDPNATVTLFPVNVTQSSEVTGQTLSTTPVGGYAANAPGSTATALAVDMTFPAGCYTIDGSGAMGSSSVTVLAEQRSIDDAGAPTSGWSTLFSKTYTFATRSPQRVSEKVTVSAARYEVRVSRTDAELNGTSGSNSIAWAGLRAFIDGPSSFPVSTVAIRIRANDQLSQASARKFGVLCTRMLPVWDTGTSTFITQATRNPGWAFYDAAVDSDYGANLPPSKVDFQGVFDLAAAATTRGDNFDFRFVSANSAPNAFDTILKVARARHRWSGDILTVVRDEWSDTPRMLLTDREVVRNSLSIDYALNTDDSADAVILEYLDENTWRPADVQYPPNTVSFTSTQPSRIRVDGIVQRDHAYREAGFYYLCSQLRRVAATLTTEHDGRMLGFGSRIRVQTELPQTWGYSGVVTNVATRTLTLSPAPTWTVGQTHYISIRQKTGRPFGPVICTKGDSDDLAVLDATDLAAVETAQSTTLAAVVTRRDGAEDPSFDFGPGTLRARDCVVVSGRPSGDNVTLSVLVDNQSVHNTDLGGTPVTPTSPLLKDPKLPLIVGLLAVFRQGIAEPMIDVSWFPAAGAEYYNAEISYDSGNSWTPVYQGISSQCTFIAEYAAARVRVQGVGRLKGPWSQVDIAAPTIQVKDQAVALQSLQDGIKQYITDLETRLQSIETTIQHTALWGAEQDAQNILDVARTRGTLQTRTDEFRNSIAGVSASVTVLENTVADDQAALAQYQVTVEATLNSHDVKITQNSTAIAQVGGKLAASWGVTLTVDGYASGFYNYNTGVGSSAFIIDADFFQIAAPGRAGGSPTPVFTLGTIGGAAAIGIRGNMVLDGTITANKLNVGTLSAIVANFGDATFSGQIRSASTKMTLDCSNNRILITD